MFVINLLKIKLNFESLTNPEGTNFYKSFLNCLSLALALLSPTICQLYD